MNKVSDRNNLKERRLILTQGFRMLLSIIFFHPHHSGIIQVIVVGALVEPVYLSEDKMAESVTGTKTRHT